MITAAIYKLSDGAIQRFVSAPDSSLGKQCLEGEEFYLNCPRDATHIINNEPVTIVVAPAAEELMAEIRARRNRLMSSCDWTQVNDSPLLPERRAAWAVYRQALRDFPSTCDVSNPVWPVRP